MGLSFDEISGQHRDNPSQPSSSQEAASTPPEAQKGPPQDDFEEFDIKPEPEEIECQECFSKTFITPRSPARGEQTYEERVNTMWAFVGLNEDILKTFGEISSAVESKSFLLKHPSLVCEEAIHFYVTYCLNLAMEEKSSLMEKVAHQRGLLLFLHRLAGALQLDPKSCIATFFSRLEKNDEYREVVMDELTNFKQKIVQLADQKLVELEAEEKYEEELDRLERLGPGGLDPLEVYEILPEDWQKHFKTKDLEGLKSAVKVMPKSEACFHLRNCLEAGLWEISSPLASDVGPGSTDEDGDLESLLNGKFITDGPVDLADYDLVDTDSDEEDKTAEATVVSSIDDIEKLIFGADMLG